MAAGMMPGITAESLASSSFAGRRALRRALLERRLALPNDEWERLSAIVCTRLRDGFRRFSGMRVAFCWPVNKEPDLRPVIAQWASEQHPGFTALLPVVIDESSALRFRAWSPATPMRADRHGIPTPASGDFLVPQALLLPVNGFDAAGYRIGYGGGYFDRTLPGLAPRPLVVGVGFELARLDSIRPEAHDQPLDVMVTEAGIFRPSP